MTMLADILLPSEILVYVLNMALASLVPGGIAVVLSRISYWLLPTRHALLVAALAISLAAPLVIPFGGVSSV